MHAATTTQTRSTDGLTGKLYRFHGFRIVDRRGQEVGLVDWIWAHDIEGHGEFIGTHLRWLRGSARAIPVTGAQIDTDAGTIRLSVTREQAARAPRYSITRRLRTDQKLAVIRHFARHAVSTIGHRVAAERAA